jgi:single-strand DNA-binding protein
MRSVNKVIIIGNLTRDPDLKKTTGGQPIATFGIATNREWASREGERHSSSEFHEVIAWSKLAELCAQHLKKGKLVYIEGYLKTRSFETAEGIKKFRTEIVANDMIMLEKRPRNDNENFDAAPLQDDEMPLEEMPPEEASQLI